MVGNTVIGAAPIAADWSRSASRVGAVSRADAITGGIAFGGVLVLIVAAPFERTRPLIDLPGQSISNLEAALLLVFLAWAAANALLRRLPAWRTPLTLPWIAWLVVLVAASVAAPAFHANALHLTGRMTAAFGVFLLTFNGITTRRRLIASVAVSLVVSAVVNVVIVLEYLRIPAVVEALKAFRPFLTMVGAQVRAGGPLQYPTIASMYLEIASACGVGLMLAAVNARRSRTAALIFAALVFAGLAVTLTFTRAGLMSLIAVLALLFAIRYRTSGIDTGARLIVALAAVTIVLFVVSRPLQSVWVRFTSESQNAWYSAVVAAPDAIRIDTGRTILVPLTITNAGRVPWDSTATMPVFLSYHWMAPDQDRYIVFEGVRTPFAAAIAPGESVAMDATVRAPTEPGSYRLVWDVVLEHRLWFNTEPGATAAISRATIEGEPAGAPVPAILQPRREKRVRPGRLVLWSAAARMLAAHPLLGIGPDNFRLSYAEYAGLPAIDRRVHSNNMYLEMLAGSGLAGALVFLWLLVSSAAMGVAAVRTAEARTLPLAAGVAAALVAIAVHGLVDSFLSFAPMYIVFAMMLGLAAACARGLESRDDAHRV